MNEERRKRLKEKAAAERAKNAGLPDGATVTTKEPESYLAWGKHFVSEIQADDEGNDVYAVYRVTDWMSNSVEGTADQVAPVHVFDLANDAAVAIVVLDKLVDEIEGEDAPGVTLPSPVVQPASASPTDDAQNSSR